MQHHHAAFGLWLAFVAGQAFHIMLAYLAVTRSKINGIATLRQFVSARGYPILYRALILFTLFWMWKSSPASLIQFLVRHAPEWAGELLTVQPFPALTWGIGLLGDVILDKIMAAAGMQSEVPPPVKPQGGI